MKTDKQLENKAGSKPALFILQFKKSLPLPKKMKKFFQILILLFCAFTNAQDSILVKEAYEQVEMFVTKRAFVVSYKAFYKIEAGGTEGVFVNSVFSGGRTDNSTFTLYVNPYMVVNNGGIYTKHIYAGSERVVSKMGDPDSYGADPRRIAKAGDFLPADKKPDYAAKYKAGQVQVRDNYDKFEVEFLGVDNDDYVNGEGFCCNDNASSKYAPFGGNIGAGNDNYENIQYYYHYDHLGSVTAITDLYGNIVQRADYIPTGEVFMEERNNSLTTSYLFNAKELDEETGLYYYGARYYNPRENVWLSIDPLAEKYAGVSPYVYTLNNPVNLIDPLGLEPEDPPRDTYYWGEIYKDKTGNFIGRLDGGWDVIRPDGEKEIITPEVVITVYKKNLFLESVINQPIRLEHTVPIGPASDGPIQFIGGAGDPFGIFEAIGMALSSSDSDAKYAALPLLVIKGQGDDALKLLSTEKGLLSTKVHGNSLQSTRPTWGYKLYSNDGTFLKNGITSKPIPETRYTKSFMLDKEMVTPPKPFPNRFEAWQWEYQQNLIQPGPLNKNMH